MFRARPQGPRPRRYKQLQRPRPKCHSHSAQGSWWYVRTANVPCVRLQSPVEMAVISHVRALVQAAHCLTACSSISAMLQPQVARRSDMDMNGHVNNVTYLSWALECIPDEVYSCHSLFEVRAHIYCTLLCLCLCVIVSSWPTRMRFLSLSLFWFHLPQQGQLQLPPTVRPFSVAKTAVLRAFSAGPTISNMTGPSCTSPKGAARRP